MSKQSSIGYLLELIRLNDKEFYAMLFDDKVIEKAKQMHKQEIVEAYRNGRTDQQSGIDKWYNRSSSGYYEITYGGNQWTSELLTKYSRAKWWLTTPTSLNTGKK